MRAEVDHNFQLGHESFETDHVAVRADHFHGHRRLGLVLFDADRFTFDDPPERSHSQLPAWNNQ